MQFSLTSAMAVSMAMLSALGSASPLMHKRQSNSTEDSWPVSGFTVGCSPAACEYSFVVTRAAGSGNPGFNTSCTGNDATDEWHTCADSSVSSRILAESGLWQVDVQHEYSTGSAGGFIETWANATVELEATTFNVNVYKSEGAE